MVDVLRSLAAQALYQFAELSRCHVMMIGPIFSDDRSQSAGSQTVHMFDGEQAIRRDFPRLDPKLSHGLLEEKARAPDVARCAHTHDEVVLAAWFQFECFVKGCHPVDFHERYAKFPGRSFHGLFGDVTVIFLNVLKDFNELMGLTAPSLQDLIQCLNRHFDLLISKDTCVLSRYLIPSSK